MRVLICLMCVLFIFNESRAQDKFTLNGYVRDASSGEELIGVTVLIKETGGGVNTNAYGFYSITLPEGNYTIEYRYIGFQRKSEKVQLNKDVSLNINLEEETVELSEVVVTAEREDANVTNIQMSRNEVNIEQLKKLPALFGEPDVIKTIQMLPGVVSAGEGTSSFFVRGGSADQNLILIDEAPVYDPSHLFGLFSVFNADVIKDSELYKGGIPSRFGGRLSSILEVRTKDGNNKEFGGEAGIGLLASSVMLEGPIKKEESSFIVSARRSYVDLALRAANQKNLVYFYDVNAKVNWRANNKNRFFLALYSGRDDFNFDGNFGFDWGNRTATFRWNHLFNDRLFSNTSFIASSFDYGLGSTEQSDGFQWDSNLQEYSLKQDLNYFFNPKLTLDFGYHLTYRKFAPGKIVPSEESIFKETELQEEFALDHAAYFGLQHQISEKLTFEYGARLSIFQNIGENTVYTYFDKLDNVNPIRIDSVKYGSFENIKTYVNLEPRFSARLLLNNNSSLKASYNRMVQNTHLISSGTVPLPFNTWAPSSTYLKPQTADQVAIGYFKNFGGNAYEFSVESFYKDIQNVTDFADNAQIFFNQDLSTEFRQGTSEAYGLELMLQKNKGKLTGFVAYTLSRVTRNVEGVNLNRTFVANHDRRHNLNVIGTYDFSDKWTFGGSFTYGTGRPITLPSGSYEFSDGQIADVITERNGFRLPNFHRVDLSATLVPQKNKDRKYETSWVFSLYNVYSRKNPFSIYTRVRLDDDDNVIGDGTEKEARLIYLFPILPSVTFNIKF
ncbi:TonB-dependent receptor [Roseivirga misakiensis]|uniref:TonB-dependent receptor n=1 Tax=Roseivirga misakiensis TaxID=1563681 RepID=A0A1E5T099_9BACT|nr:TonB-dependent receptor [Roseivirga misakiensis]OEK04789.1 TonB-dependent receptor [Roseivirga misakiensis]